MWRFVVRTVRDRVDELEDVLFRHQDARIAKPSLPPPESARLSAVSASSVGLHVSQRELGNIAGGSRESVNKHLQAWHKAGWIDLGKGTIVIRNLAAINGS